MRRIAEETEYTPSTLYQYFPLKEEMLGQCIHVKYKKLMESLFSAQQAFDNFDDRLTAITRTYIESALTFPNKFTFSQLYRNQTERVLTSFMFKNTSRENMELQLFTQFLRDINQEKVFEEIELIAQAIAAPTIGLTITLNSENQLEQRQKDLLVYYFAEEVVISMAKIV